MKRWLWLVLLLLCAPAVTGTEVNVAIYNYSTTRMVVYRNGVWQFIMDPQEYRGLTVTWDEAQTFDFFRYPQGSINNAYRVQTWVSKFREYQEIRIYDQDLP